MCGADERRPPGCGGGRAGVPEPEVDRGGLPADAAHGAADGAALPRAAAAAHHAGAALGPGVAATTGGRAPRPADLADEAPDAGPSQGRALPPARADQSSKSPSDRPAGGEPPPSRDALANEDGGGVRRGKPHPPGLATCRPDLLGSLRIALDLLSGVSIHCKLRLNITVRTTMWWLPTARLFEAGRLIAMASDKRIFPCNVLQYRHTQ